MRSPERDRGPRWTVLALVAVAHVWTMGWLSWELAPEPLRNPQIAAWGLPGALGWAMAGALGVVVGGGLLARVVPAGCRGVLTRLLVGGGALAAGVVAASMLGAASALLAAAAGMGLVFYRAVGRFFPAVAVVGAGVWHALVLAVPDPALSVAWPAVLAMTHASVLAFLARVYGMDGPGLSPRAAWTAVLGWAFVALLLVGGMTARGATLLVATGPTGRWVWLAPAMAVAAFVVLAAAWTSGGGDERSTQGTRGRSLVSLGVWWLVVYNAAWLAGAGLVWQAGAVLILMGGAIWPRTRTGAAPGWRLP